MSFVCLGHWLGRLILVILFIDCFSRLACSMDLPRKEFVGISENDIRSVHPRWFRPEGHTVRRRSSLQSALAVNTSEVNGTAEAEVLLEFRKGVTEDPLQMLSSWNSNNISNYCNWPGVNCSNPVGPVIALNLSGYQLVGTISPSLGALQFLLSLDLSNNVFRGWIPTSIANCSNLIVLNISYNDVSGSIPTELTSLSNLEELDLSWNTITGVLSPSLSNLSALRVLNLESNQIPGDLMSMAWGGFGQLERLNLSYNQITGAIPASLNNCSSLIDLDLSINNFTGIIPDIFGKLPKLQWLDLGYNFLTGSIPPSLSSLRALRFLSFYQNSLTGSLPTSLLNCSSLAILFLDYNQLTGEIPPEIGMLSRLEIISLATNNLTGSIPPTVLNCSSLTGLYVYQNELTGEIPAAIGMLSRLHNIYLWNNNLRGFIPLSLLNCTSLSEIIFSYNFFSGEIPQAIGRLSQLKRLYLHFNNFVGGIPASLGNSSTIQEVVIDNNRLIGEIPPQLGLLKNLSKLDLSSNFITGQIPVSLGNSTALISLNLANNGLSGQIPPSIGELTNLQGLNLSHNQLTGGIPAALSNCSELSVLDLSGNLLSDSIPSELGTLAALNKLYLNNNNLTGSISSALKEASINLIEISLAYNRLSGVIAGDDFGSLRNLQLGLDLSHNLLSGPLPSGIRALEFVQNINLSFNAFSGAITNALSQCTGLESLDLSSNNLDGEIPQSLTTLQYLTYFNVSFNQLTGSVPNSGQFPNFGNGSFLGNPGLCGPMLPNKCGSSCSGIHCHKLWVVIIPAVAAGIAGVLALAGVWFLFIAKTSDSSGMDSPALPNASYFTGEVEGLSVGDIVAATNGFSDASIMGVGTKSTVFAGVLPSGVMIAVKRFELRKDDKATGQLYRELERLCKLVHPNLLKVCGLFSSGDLKALVLEYMPNGSLHKQMYEGESCGLTWAQRLNIALGVAEAMVHLHHSESKPIIHMDLKPNNILLDSDMEPKVADYGISRFLNHETHGDATISSNLFGTIGYIPPEYGALTSVSTMGDVYNFGVVLMEMFTRKQPTDDTFGQEVSLHSWVMDAFPGRISQILDSTLHQELAQNEQDVGIHLMVRLAIACTRSSAKDRPTMIQARDMLMEIKSIEQP